MALLLDGNTPYTLLVLFVEDGDALLGGTSDGVVWYCPMGPLRAYGFLKAKIQSLDVSPDGAQALVSQMGGRAHLVSIQRMDCKGKIEQVYATNGLLLGLVASDVDD